MTRKLDVGTGAGLVPTIGEALEDPGVREIVVHPGTYVEHLVVHPRPAPLEIRSSTGDPADVVVTFGLRQGDRDRTGLPWVQGCATVTVAADDVLLRGLTVENSYDRTLHPDLPDSQAIALRTTGNRIRVQDCRLLGMQDTVLLDAPGWSDVRRVHLRDCLVVGDVDFVYGRATAVIEGGEVRSCGPGWVAAPSTARENPRGFLFRGVRFTGPGLPAGSVRLGRPWHPGGKPDAVGSAYLVDCELGEHVAADAWDDMGGFSWREARFGERGSTGPGAPRGAAADRPAVPADVDVDGFLTGWDGPPAPGGKILVASDSTAGEYGPDRAPRTGWGQVLAGFTDREVVNLAVSGASTRSFLDSGAYDDLLARVAPGDLVLIAFGHNDAKPGERFADVFRDYPANLRRMVVGARARGATPVLLSPVERRRFDEDGRAGATHGGYPAAVRELAVADGVAFVDLTAATRRTWQEQGPHGSAASFLHLAPGEWPAFPDGERDDTHLSVDGARTVAALVARGLTDRGLLTRPVPAARGAQG
ncbi:pectinesterase family protein [Kineococcus sp. SYSU DK001]|uniref:pectinesterase family protein n=1 Tax=Kineococcus sp. SYSU DK001 TaxID=3383122 RepID=UPI003D7CE0AC